MILVHGCLQFALVIILGAFAAHGLKPLFSEYQMQIWHTATQYHAYHALGILLLSVKYKELFIARWIHLLFTLGIFLFSGSLYLLALTQIKWLGAITPIGGISYIAGWLIFAYAAWKSEKDLYRN